MFSSAFSWRGMNTENSVIRGSNLERHNFPFWSVPTLMTPSNPGWSRTSNHFVQLYPEEKKIGTMPTASYPVNIKNKLTIIEPVNIVIKTIQKKLYKSYYVYFLKDRQTALCCSYSSLQCNSSKWKRQLSIAVSLTKIREYTLALVNV